MTHRESSYGSPRSISAPAIRGVIAAPTTFAQRVLRAPSQDPHLLWHEGLYYYCESNREGIFVRVAADFLELGSASRQLVWTPPRRGRASRNVWAPEIQRIDGKCYIYFAADDGVNENHRMFVLAAATDDPAGAYQLVAELDTEGWAIDGTVLTDAAGQRYLVWSGWAGRRNGQQNLYIARMKSPVELHGGRVLLAMPDQPWECRGMAICEGPQILQRHGRTFIVYSASGSWTEDYCLGLLAHDGNDFMNPAQWYKAGPVFSKNQHAWGVGHCGFVESAEGDHWLMYHAKTSRRAGWGDREVRAQPFTWSLEGRPVFGEPLAVLRPLVARKMSPVHRRRSGRPTARLAHFSA